MHVFSRSLVVTCHLATDDSPQLSL